MHLHAFYITAYTKINCERSKINFMLFTYKINERNRIFREVQTFRQKFILTII